MLVLETKGRDSDQDQTKRKHLAEWVCGCQRPWLFGIGAAVTGILDV